MKIQRRHPTTYKPKAFIATYFNSIMAAKNHIAKLKRIWRDKVNWVILEDSQGFFVINEKYL